MDLHTISRRNFLRLLAIACGSLLTSCVHPQGLSTKGYTPIPSPVKPSPSQAPPTSSPALPQDLQSKIDTVIILLQENHSFDSLFAGYPGTNSKRAPNTCPDAIQHAIPEGGTAIHYFCSYDEVQVPNYWELARHFTLCDNYFSEVRAPSFPNYMMLTSAETPKMANPHPPYECPNYCVDATSIANRLDKKGFTWHDYGGLFANIESLRRRPEISYRDFTGFDQLASEGKLPNVTWIGAYLVGGTKLSGHPPSSICGAENFAVEVINRAMASPQWPKMLVILIWDEWGSFYDHIVPPVVERLPNGNPFRYGFRVPCILISPWARPGYVAHTQFSHVSTLRAIETIFNLPALNQRDGSASNLLDCLDFNQEALGPVSLPARTCSS